MFGRVNRMLKMGRSGLLLAWLAVFVGVGSAAIVHAHEQGWHQVQESCLVCDFEQLLGHGAVQADARQPDGKAIDDAITPLPARLPALKTFATGVIRAPPIFS